MGSTQVVGSIGLVTCSSRYYCRRQQAYEVKDNTITPEYMTANKEIVEKQLLKGGYRLAKILTTIFG